MVSKWGTKHYAAGKGGAKMRDTKCWSYQVGQKDRKGGREQRGREVWTSVVRAAGIEWRLGW